MKLKNKPQEIIFLFVISIIIFVGLYYIISTIFMDPGLIAIIPSVVVAGVLFFVRLRYILKH